MVRVRSENTGVVFLISIRVDQLGESDTTGSALENHEGSRCGIRVRLDKNLGVA